MKKRCADHAAVTTEAGSIQETLRFLAIDAEYSELPYVKEFATAIFANRDVPRFAHG